MWTLFLSALAMLAVAGCALFERTPAQERVYSRYETVCSKRYPGHQLVSVASDGQSQFSIFPTDTASAFAECMSGNPNWTPQPR
jgi:hypothetical protein